MSVIRFLWHNFRSLSLSLSPWLFGFSWRRPKRANREMEGHSNISIYNIYTPYILICPWLCPRQPKNLRLAINSTRYYMQFATGWWDLVMVCGGGRGLCAKWWKGFSANSMLAGCIRNVWHNLWLRLYEYCVYEMKYTFFGVYVCVSSTG